MRIGSCDRFVLSAAYVRDAADGRYYKSGLANIISHNNPVALWCFKVHTSLPFIVIFVIVTTLHSMLAFCEPVQMTARSTNVLLWVVISGVFALVAYFVDVILFLTYTTRSDFISSTHNKIYVLIILVLTLDYILYFGSGRMIFRLLRPTILLLRIRPLRGTGIVMFGVIPKFLQFLLIMGTYIGLFAAIGVHIFMEFYSKEEVRHDPIKDIFHGSFDNAGIAVLNVFVVMTGGSYPLVMIPAYREARFISLMYFITIIFTGQLVLYGILVARIFDFYVESNKRLVKSERFRERQCLIKAFETLDVVNNGQINRNQWKSLLLAIKPQSSDSEISKRFAKLKEMARKEHRYFVHEGDSTISLIEFFHVLDVLRYVAVTPATPTDTAFMQPVGNSLFKRIIRVLRNFSVDWSSSEMGYRTAIFFNVLFLLLISLVWFGMDPTTSSILFGFQFATLLLICTDALLRASADGFTRQAALYLSLPIIATVCLLFIYFIGYSTRPSKGWAAIVAHAAVVFRMIGFRKRSASLLRWTSRMAPPLCTLLCLIGIGFYTYGIIGMECFSHLSKKLGSRVLPKGVSLCTYSFETLGCSSLTLFQISLGSSWHKVMIYIMKEVSPWASIYFVFFYAMMQMVVLNVISAVMVELSNAIHTDEGEAHSKDATFQDIGGNIRQRRSPWRMTRKQRGATIFRALEASNQVGCLGRAGDSRMLTTIADKIHETPQNTNQDVEDLNNGVSLSEKRPFRSWTRDITPDMTFMNADEFKRLHEQMGKPFKGLRPRRK